MPHLPVQSANAAAAMFASPTPGMRVDADGPANGSTGSFSGVLKKEMARTGPALSEANAPAQRDQSAQEDGNQSGPDSATTATTAASPHEQDAVTDAADTTVDPSIAQILAVLANQSQPGIAPEGVVAQASVPLLTVATSAPAALAGPELPSPSSSPTQMSSGSVLGESSRLPIQAAETARLSHSTAPEAANPAGHRLPEQAIAGDGRVVEHGRGQSQQPQDFSLLIERASAELAAQPGPAQANMAREVSHSYRIEAPAGQPARWAQEIGDRVAWMVTSREQRAELVLNPPQLGRIEVTLAVNGDQANAWFSSPNSAVRELLETSLPRLREVMAEAGIQLGQAQVGADNPGFPARGEEQRAESASGARTRGDESGYVRLPAAGTMMAAGRGLVDIFA